VVSTVVVRNIHKAFSASGEGAKEYEASLVEPGVRIELIAVGVTEAGLTAGSPAMLLLARSLELLMQTQPQQRVSVIDLDNVSGNGDKIRQLMCCQCAASDACLAYLSSAVTFHNSVVDRITAARPTNSVVPRGEPIPYKVPPLPVAARLSGCGSLDVTRM
jgi:mannitol-1-phosphate/altronate dehydrogenase